MISGKLPSRVGSVIWLLGNTIQTGNCNTREGHAICWLTETPISSSPRLSEALVLGRHVDLVTDWCNIY